MPPGRYLGIMVLEIAFMVFGFCLASVSLIG